MDSLTKPSSRSMCVDRVGVARPASSAGRRRWSAADRPAAGPPCRSPARPAASSASPSTSSVVRGGPSGGGSSRKLPGCGSACSRPVRAGPEKRKRASSWPARSRCSVVPSAITSDSGIPSIHSVTSTCSDWCTTSGTTTSGSSANSAACSCWASGLQLVVQLLGHPVAQLRDQRLDVHAGDQRAQQPGEAAQLGEVGQQRLAGARVLHLHRDVAPVVPHGPVHLPDRGGGGRLVLELRNSSRQSSPSRSASTPCTVRVGIGGAASWSLVSAAR